jgi:hypothetical protein
MSLKIFNIRFFALCVMCIAVTPVSADLDERYKLTMGASLTNFDSKIRINSRDDSIDNEIDFEDKLGFDTEVRLGWIKGTWRVADRHRLNLLYLPIRRTAEKNTSRDIDVGGNIIKSGAFVGASFKTDVFDFEYDYSFYKRPNIELAVTAGLYWINSVAEFAAAGQIILEGENQAEFRSGYEANQRLIAPLPLLGLSVDYEINPQWRTRASARYLDVTISDVAGRILSLNLETEYYFTNYLGAGASITSFDLSVRQNGVVFFNTMIYRYTALQAYLVLKY